MTVKKNIYCSLWLFMLLIVQGNGSALYAQVVERNQNSDSLRMVELYEQAKTFGRENPERTALIAFGVGVGVGLLVGTRRSRSGRIVQPLIDAAYDVTSALVR